MAIRITCPICGYRIKAPDNAFGRRGCCPRCKLMIRLPSEQELLERKQKSPEATGQPPLDGCDTALTLSPVVAPVPNPPH